MRKIVLFLIAAVGVGVALTGGMNAPAPLADASEQVMANIASRVQVDRTNKTSQLQAIILIADGSDGAIISGPMSRMQAENEMRDLYPDAPAKLLIEDGHGRYIDTGARSKPAPVRRAYPTLVADRLPD